MAALATVYAELRNACETHGGQRAWAKSVGVSEQYVSDVLNARRDPGEKILTALGFRRVTTYQRSSNG